MNPVWHLFWTYILFRTKKDYWKSLAFAIIPDIPAIILLVFMILTVGTTFEFFSTSFKWPMLLYERFFHSIIAAGALFMLTIIAKKKEYVAYFYGWIFHIVLDAFTHGYDGWPLFWPLSEYTLPNKFSYWNIAQHALEVNIINLILASIAVLWLMNDGKNKKFEVWFLTAILLGSVASFFFYTQQASFRTPWFITWNMVMLIISAVFMIKFRAAFNRNIYRAKA